MYLLAVAFLLQLPQADPAILSVHSSLEACVIALGKVAKQNEEKLHEPSNEARGMRLVCLKVMEPTI